jgi:hypothetical protein
VRRQAIDAQSAYRGRANRDARDAFATIRAHFIHVEKASMKYGFFVSSARRREFKAAMEDEPAATRRPH